MLFLQAKIGMVIVGRMGTLRFRLSSSRDTKKPLNTQPMDTKPVRLPMGLVGAWAIPHV